MTATYIFIILSMAARDIFLLGMGIYYAYMYYLHVYRSEERILRITNIEIHSGRYGSKYYYIIGELVDMPGEQLKSLDSFSLRAQYLNVGEVIPVRYADTKRFAINPKRFLRDAVMLIIIAAIMVFLQIGLCR